MNRLGFVPDEREESQGTDLRKYVICIIGGNCKTTEYTENTES